MKKEDIKPINLHIENISLPDNGDYPDSEVIMHDECQVY